MSKNEIMKMSESESYVTKNGKKKMSGSENTNGSEIEYYKISVSQSFAFHP